MAKKKKSNPKGAGRKPAVDKKIQLSVYAEKSIVEANGGKKEAESKAYQFLKSQVKE